MTPDLVGYFYSSEESEFEISYRILNRSSVGENQFKNL